LAVGQFDAQILFTNAFQTSFPRTTVKIPLYTTNINAYFLGTGLMFRQLAVGILKFRSAIYNSMQLNNRGDSVCLIK
jgi:hypothetical protein